MPARGGPGRAGGAARRRRVLRRAAGRAAHDAHISFAIGARRIAPLWRLLAGLADEDWHDAIEMDNARSRSRSTARTGGRPAPGC